MSKGIALNLGLNIVNPQHYDGWNGALSGCINDANDMYAIAKEQGFVATQLLDAKADRKNVILAIKQAATVLSSGDIFFISYSGHGGQVPDDNNDERDHLDETWCLYDGQLIDDELKQLWTRFKEGVRILVISDSCHSGTITKAAQADGVIEYSKQTSRNLPYQQAEKVWKKNKAFYQEISTAVPRGITDIKASIQLLSGCQDNQLSYDGEKNGAFTTQLLRAWDGGRFRGNYQEFHKKILMNMPAHQSPNHMVIGSVSSNFSRENPFKI